MTDPNRTHKRSNRLIAGGILAILIGVTLIGISTFVSARLILAVGSERISIPTISLFEIPSYQVSFSPPSARGDISLAQWLADQIENSMYVILMTAHTIGGFLVLLGTLTFAAVFSLAGR